MKAKEELLRLTNAYLVLFPNEEKRVQVFVDYLHRNDTTQLYTRKNFDGHITTSAFIVDADRKELLLLRHKSLERWLQPGGHTEGDASLVASALREAVEETGMTAAQLQNRPVLADTEVPFDIDSHYIPANPKKEEDGHYHHDLRYVFLYHGDRSNDFNAEEATGMQWVAFSALAGDATFGDVVKKLQAIL